MEAKVVNLKSEKVIGLVYRGPNQNGEIPAMWEVFNTRFKEIINPDLTKFYGLCYDCDMPGSFAYMAGLAVSEVTQLPEGMELQELPAGKYAIFTFKDPISKIGEFWDAIYKTGLKENGLEAVNGMTFELYDERFHQTGECDIYIPVK